MTPARALLIALAGMVLLIGARPLAGDTQFPRGLLAASPRDGTCTIETRSVSFGTYDPLAVMDGYAIGDVRFLCHRDRFGRLLRVRIEISTGGAGSFDRYMRSGTRQLLYNLYLKPDYRKVWGDGSSGTDYYFELLPPSDTLTIVPAYGRIGSLQDVYAGEYTDTLQVKIIF